MKKEARSQTAVAVGVDPMWQSLKNLVSIVPKIRPNLVKSVEIIEGDGGLGTVFLFTFGSGESLIKKKTHLFYITFRIEYLFLM